MTVVILLKAQTEILTATVQLSRELPMEIRLRLLPAAILTPAEVPEEIPAAALIQAAIPAAVPQSLLTTAVKRLRHSHQAAEVQAAAPVEAQEL